MESKLRILLIGKTGQLAGEIIKNAPDFGFDVLAFDKNEFDITDFERAQKKIAEIKPDIFINTAAYHMLSECEKNPFLAMNVNFLAVAKLAELCKKYKIQFITFSTDYVFDGAKGSPYEEDDLPNPLQMYAVSKLAGEYAVLSIYPENSFIIRTCGLYGGKYGSPEKNGNFILNIIKEAKGKDSIKISSEQIVSPTYAGHLSDAILKLLQNKNANPGIYHLINKGYCSWHEFAREIFNLAGIKTKVIPVDRGGDVASIKKPKFSALENIKAKSLGIELPSWQEGLKKYLTEIK